jgi:ppGpp synthetase/RelA/SpoT-type nucleotidyltranferase
MVKKNNKNREQDRFTVVLEAIQSDFQVFGEKLDLVDNRLGKMELHLDRIELELVNIKFEISELKAKLDKKADLERLEKLEKRIKQIEIILAKAK